MNYSDDIDQTEDQKHWAGWTMQPAKPQLAWTIYASALVTFAASIVVVAGNIA